MLHLLLRKRHKIESRVLPLRHSQDPDVGKSSRTSVRSKFDGLRLLPILIHRSGYLTVEATLRALVELRLIVEVLSDVQRSEDMLMVQLLVFPGSKEPSYLQHVLDLPTVHAHARQLHQLRRGDGVLLRRRVEEVGPHRLA
jgi:hypothetical protein